MKNCIITMQLLIMIKSKTSIQMLMQINEILSSSENFVFLTIKYKIYLQDSMSSRHYKPFLTSVNNYLDFYIRHFNIVVDFSSITVVINYQKIAIKDIYYKRKYKSMHRVYFSTFPFYRQMFDSRSIQISHIAMQSSFSFSRNIDKILRRNHTAIDYEYTHIYRWIIR